MRKILTAILLLSLSTMQAGNYIYQPDGRMSFEWNTKDVAALFSTAGTIMELTVKAVNESDSHYSTLEQEGWALASSVTYYGSYPYSVYHKLAQSPYTALPISYTNQTQTANNNTAHLAAADFMTAQAESSEDALSVTYTHLGCIMRIAAYVPETKTFSSLTLTTQDNTAWFAEEATIDATDNTMTTAQLAATATLALNNITVQEGDSLIAYMMMPPTDMSDRSLQLSVNATDGSALQTYIVGCNMQAARVYPVSVGKENYFRIQSTGNGSGNETQNALSLPFGIEDKAATANQIFTATAYAADFAPDTENAMTSFLLGDVNFDGVVNVTDAVMVINHYQARTTEELDFNVSDVNGDNVINVTDAVGIINIYQSRQQ